jgi:phosphatidylinositol alpha-1,6-mannosyltransferase
MTSVKGLLIAEVFPPAKGGSGRWLWELYRRLQGMQVDVVAGEVAGADAFDRDATLSIYRVPLSFSNWGLLNPRGACEYARAFVRIHRVVRRVRPDVIHCGKSLPDGLIALVMKRLYRIPYYCFVHGEELTLAGTSRELGRLTRTVLRESAGVIANSRHSRDILVRDWGVPKARVTIMHPGVDTAQFTPSPVDAKVRQQLGWTSRRVILSVGALQKRKGQDMMIRALPIIRRRFPDVLYAIVGEGWERSYLNDLVAEHGVGDLVQFRGVPSDVELVQCYQQCDVFALPNRQVGWDFEGFGIVLLEAQACGKPVIAGRSGGTSETLDPSRTGVLVACETPETLADAVCGIFDDPQRGDTMGRDARDWVVRHFDWNVLRLDAERMFAGAVPTSRV